MPGALLPDDPATPAPADWYSPAELAVFRLSSKSHWDLPIDDRRHDRALPGQPPDAAGVRRPGGPQRHAQPRRDPALGRLHHARRTPATSTTTRATPAACAPGAQFVIAGDQNSDPLDGDSIPGCDPAAARQPAGQHRPTRRPATGAVEAAGTAGRGSTSPTVRPGGGHRGLLRHRRLRRLLRAGQPARRLRAAEQGPADPRTRASSGRPTSDPLFCLTGRLPVPDARTTGRSGSTSGCRRARDRTAGAE